MNKTLLLIPSVTVLLFVETILVTLLSILFLKAVSILIRYKRHSTSSAQYALEKESYLLSSFVQITLFIYFPFLLFFIYILNDLSSIVPGAMCAAGVISSNDYGEFLVVLKFVIAIALPLWLAFHKEDVKTRRQIYFEKKLYFFLLLYLLIIAAYVLEILFLTHINTQSVVSCCSIIYDTQEQIIPFSKNTLAALFYLNFIVIIFALVYKKKILLISASVLFLYLSYLSITYFFGLYIYELPSHHCPYCILSKDYYFIGYFIYGTLVLSTYYALSAALFGFVSNVIKKALFFYIFFIVLLSFKLLYYYFVNHTLL